MIILIIANIILVVAISFAEVKRLTDELNSCETRINDMAQENANLKEQIKALEKPAKKGKK